MPASHPLSAKFERCMALTGPEREALDQVAIKILTIAPDQNLVREGDKPTRSVMILGGVACTSKLSTEGKRQITAFHIAGDMPDLLSLHLRTIDSDIRTIGECMVGFIDHVDIRRTCELFPRLASALWRATLIDAAILREWVVNVGQRPAPSRIAHLFCELMCRMDAAGLVTDRAFAFDVTQTDLAAATGLSTVHVNRTLQDLRRRKLVTYAHGVLTILDWPGLVRLADFRTDYLHEIADCPIEISASA